MRLSTSIRPLSVLSRIRTPLAIALTSTFVSGCGTLVCMDGPCDAVMADIYSNNLFTSNEFLENRTDEQIADDIWACKSQGEAEQVRLIIELREYDPYLQEYAERTGRNDSLGQSLGNVAASTDVDTSGDGVRVSGGGSSSGFERDMAGAVGSMLVSMVMGDGYDPNKQPLIDLENYLTEDDTYVRFTNMCLREAGYQIDENAEDGIGTVSVNPEQLAVTVRRDDCVEVTLYKKDPVRDENGDLVFDGNDIVYSEAALPGPAPVADCVANVSQVDVGFVWR